ncbi:MAG TPA: radical SAM family heme chaperone HemW [Polyangia bacterium]
MFGVYIHFPYCRKRCPYCDFAVHARARIPHDRYAEKVVAELEARAPLFAGRRAHTLYFGGGTPGLWRSDCIAKVVAAVRDRFALGEKAEVTVEANPDDLPRAQLDGLLAAGVNRLSIGVESLEPKHLATLGRLHGPNEAVQAVREARAAGFTNLSLDLMFGLPAQTMVELERDLDGLLALSPEHLSVYNLTVEERTPFFALTRSGALKVPDSGLCAEMYERVMARLAAAGFGHYEISSWARPGRRAEHNTLYWTGGEYLGLGCSAASHRRLPGKMGGERFSNVRSVDEWFAAAPGDGEDLARDPALGSYERLDGGALEKEALWLGLRFLDGLDRARHAARHGADPLVHHAGELERLAREGLVTITEDRIRLTPRGVLFADEVGARLL